MPICQCRSAFALKNMQNSIKKKILGNIILFGAAIIWGFAFVAQVVGVSGGLGPVTFNAIRFLLGAVVLIPVIFIFERKKESGREKKRLLLGSLICGFFLFAAANLQQYALSINENPGFAGFITALYTVWTPVACFLVFKKKTAANVWIAVGLSIVGFYLLCMTDGGGVSFGLDTILLLISTLFWSAQILSVDRFVSGSSALKLSVGQYVVCALLSFAYAFAFESHTWTIAALDGAKWSILYCGLLSVGVAYTFQTIGQRMTDPTLSVIIMSTESVFSAVGGVLWNLMVPVSLQVSQNISPIGYVGCGIIFAGVIVSQIDFSRIFGSIKRSKV